VPHEQDESHIVIVKDLHIYNLQSSASTWADVQCDIDESNTCVENVFFGMRRRTSEVALIVSIKKLVPL